MSKLTLIVISLVTVGISIARFFLPSNGFQKEDIFKDIAHLYVGGMYGAWMATGERHYRNLALVLTAVETIAFFAGKVHR